MRSALVRLALATVAAVLAVGAVASGEVVQEQGLRVSFVGKVAPHTLPRQGKAPIAVTLGGQVRTVDGAQPPQLQTISIAINRNGRLDYGGLPACRYHQIQPASTREAIEACSGSVVGRGSFSAAVALPEQSPFPSQGRIVAFNGSLHGEHVLFAHIYGTEPLPQSSVIAFRIGHAGGSYGVKLTARLPEVAADWGHVSGVKLTLSRSFKSHGKERSYLSAGCPAPAGFPGAVFPLARVSFGFANSREVSATMQRSCSAGADR